MRTRALQGNMRVCTCVHMIVYSYTHMFIYSYVHMFIYKTNVCFLRTHVCTKIFQNFRYALWRNVVICSQARGATKGATNGTIQLPEG